MIIIIVHKYRRGCMHYDGEDSFELHASHLLAILLNRIQKILEDLRILALFPLFYWRKAIDQINQN